MFNPEILGLSFYPDFLNKQQQTDLIDWIGDRPESDWSTITFRGVVARRRMICYGWDYVTTSRSLRPAAPIPPTLRAVRDAAAVHAGVGNVADMTQVILIRYPPRSGIGKHIDAPVFGEPILGVSLGGDARMRFSQKPHPSGEARGHIDGYIAGNVTFPVPSGALYVMRGQARWKWLHQIMPVKEKRYSITFRRLRTDTTNT